MLFTSSFFFFLFHRNSHYFNDTVHLRNEPHPLPWHFISALKWAHSRTLRSVSSVSVKIESWHFNITKGTFDLLKWTGCQVEIHGILSVAFQVTIRARDNLEGTNGAVILHHVMLPSPCATTINATHKNFGSHGPYCQVRVHFAEGYSFSTKGTSFPISL